MPSTRVEDLLRRGRKSVRIVDPQELQDKLEALQAELNRLSIEKTSGVGPSVPGVNGKDGATGLRGPAGATGRDGSGFSWMGHWIENHTYSPHDVVNYLGSTYVALSSSKGDYPNRVNNSWDLMASAGAGGARGPAGADVSVSNHFGFVDYNDTSSSATPVSLSSEVWTSLPNDGLGTFTNLKFPTGVTNMLDASTGAILVDELPIRSSIFIRMDYTVTPSSNNSSLKFRYTLGSGAGAYTLEKSIGRLDEGSGIPYRQSLTTDYIYVGDDNTRLGAIQPQIKLSGGGTVINSGMAIEIRKE